MWRKILGDAHGVTIPDELQRMVDTKRLGKKTGAGFYQWKGGKPVKEKADGTEPPDLRDRLILPMVNEAVAVFHEGVVDNLDLLDAGVIFGTGFAPFRGGPVNYARQRGIDDVVATLERLETRYGDRFKPDSSWSRVAAGEAAEKPAA